MDVKGCITRLCGRERSCNGRASHAGNGGGSTRPLSEDEKHPKVAKRPKRPRFLKKDTVENYKRMFIENGWTDGMPIELPTEEKVEEMLTGTDHPPDEVVGMMSVTTHEERYEYTVEKVAVNAVMAGARPEHFPVILALAPAGNRQCPARRPHSEGW